MSPLILQIARILYCFILYGFLFLCLFFYVVLAESMLVHCVMHCGGQRGNQSPWNWSFRHLWATMWVLAIGPGSSGRWASPLNHWTTTQCIHNFYFHFFEQNYPKYHQLFISQDKRNIPHFPSASCHCHLGLWHRYEHLVYINTYNSSVSSLNISALSCMT